MFLTDLLGEKFKEKLPNFMYVSAIIKKRLIFYMKYFIVIFGKQYF